MENHWKNQICNDKQITDHYAIVPTGQGMGALRSLSPLNAKVYERIVRRFLSIFYPAAVYRKYSVELLSQTEHFFASFKLLKEPGYLKVSDVSRAGKNDGAEEAGKEKQPQAAESDAESREKEGSQETVIGNGAFAQMLEGLKKGTVLELKSLSVKEGETSPPKRYTSGSMILAMENAGQLIEDEELRARSRQRNRNQRHQGGDFEKADEHSLSVPECQNTGYYAYASGRADL